MPELARLIDGKKYLWDGKEYGSPGEAQDARSAYDKEGFEVRIVEEKGKCLIYSRRIAAQQAAA